jgi:hypothetical protein
MYDLNVLFYLKKAKKTKSGEAPVYLRVTVNGQRAELSVRRCWDHQKSKSPYEIAQGKTSFCICPVVNILVDDRKIYVFRQKVKV